MKDQFDEESVKYVVEAIEHLGIDGFHWGRRDEAFLKSQEELKNSVDKIIVCLKWIDRDITIEVYIKSTGRWAAKLKEAIEASEGIDIPLGCVITAIAYNFHRFRFLKFPGVKDILYFAPADIVMELKKRKRYFDL